MFDLLFLCGKNRFVPLLFSKKKTFCHYRPPSFLNLHVLSSLLLLVGCGWLVGAGIG